ncbi:MAG TPA: DUF6763 family protein [Steroidobacteraceae bacterium]|jgi:hypothetical protein|nr:DUF6763 family protein [Steroidobacteraceae bacterium]
MMSAHPGIGEWYRIRGGHQFEVVAVDEHDGTIEVQYSDGSVEELDLADWEAQDANGDIHSAGGSDDWRGGEDYERDRGERDFALSSHWDSGANISGGLDGLDLFDSNDSFGDSFNFR